MKAKITEMNKGQETRYKKHLQNRVPQAITDVFNCATNIEEYGLINYDASQLHTELTKLTNTITKMDKQDERIMKEHYARHGAGQ